MATVRAPTSQSSGSGSGSGSRRSSRRVVGEFTIEKEIGKGSFAQVYLGWHKVSPVLPPLSRSAVLTRGMQDRKQAVAIKSVELERLNKKLKENLYGEIKILKTLRHPHIVALHDCIESSTHINLIMEYCELGDLSLFIKKREKLGTHPATHDMARKYPSSSNSGLHEVIIRHFLKQLSSALEFLRSNNYVHRDVKPQNLLLLPARTVREDRGFPVMEASQNSLIPVAGLASLPMLKLADFGFARVLPSTSLADTLCGSPLYMAPEILRYERYDAKADLWSVGTVLYEMVTGRPPFRARNHVELLRKIEAAEDVIKFPREVAVTSEMKALVRGLLRRNPVERMSFENFFGHSVMTDDIPGLVDDDLPAGSAKPRQQPAPSSSSSQARSPADAAAAAAASPREQVPRTAPSSSPRQQQGGHRPSLSSDRDGLGIRRPAAAQHTASAPVQHRLGDAAARQSPADTRARQSPGRTPTEEERAAQEVMFERDYVVVERRHVEVNALADELAANEKLGHGGANPPRAGQLSRRSTQQGAPTATAGAIPTPTSRNALVAQGRPAHDRRGSYDRPPSVSPSSASSAISKAIQDASLRLFGFKVPPLRGGAKGQSPPLYQAFPAYPTPALTAGLLGDGSSRGTGSASSDEDVMAAQTIEELATRSDCVFGFAEVKYKQLIPLAPSVEHGLGGVDVDQASSDEDGLTTEAVVVLSEEALVLYVKSLTLLARAMDIASVWWAKKSRGEAATGISAAVSQSAAQRINAVVQWVRQRFNEVLEKSEIIRLKLLGAQKQLPPDHPNHPANHGVDEYSSSVTTTSSAGIGGPSSLGGVGAGAGIKHVYLTPGTSAEKLMYDRALEMSRSAAIAEVANEDLHGCELSYVTAIRMLEAVLDSDEDSSRRVAGKEPSREGNGGIDCEEEQHVRKMISMISGRLNSVRQKLQMIADASRQSRRSGDASPRP
ncbi:serine/threonine-protein kinase ULK2 [Geosmithia morbida]|uniref:non-specific serine/threonine protein kinase n=1 Tax=Geosmithia morbida TaxID=1094350 RepID=A0A9P4YY68_9HYPO|nr:serine/threonine-protein kinase ULK2 [Geosmithia morbida]KAF4123164.1 serine/threonine-protein kinase ULK2 [Geosmithia morbida]